MSLDKRYNIPEETVKKMVRDGVISCSVIQHHAIYDAYQSKKSVDKNFHTLCNEISDELGVGIDTVKKVIYKFGKI